MDQSCPCISAHAFLCQGKDKHVTVFLFPKITFRKINFFLFNPHITIPKPVYTTSVHLQCLPKGKGGVNPSQGKHTNTLTRSFTHYAKYGNANYPNMHVFGLWKETKAPNVRNMQTLCTKNSDVNQTRTLEVLHFNFYLLQASTTTRLFDYTQVERCFQRPIKFYTIFNIIIK